MGGTLNRIQEITVNRVVNMPIIATNWEYFGAPEKNNGLINMRGFKATSGATLIPVTIGGYTFYAIAKVDNADPFGLGANNSIGFDAIVVSHLANGNGYNIMTFTTLAIRNDGANSYITLGNNLYVPSTADFIYVLSLAPRLFNSQPI